MYNHLKSSVFCNTGEKIINNPVFMMKTMFEMLNCDLNTWNWAWCRLSVTLILYTLIQTLIESRSAFHAIALTKWNKQANVSFWAVAQTQALVFHWLRWLVFIFSSVSGDAGSHKSAALTDSRGLGVSAGLQPERSRGGRLPSLFFIPCSLMLMFTHVSGVAGEREQPGSETSFRLTPLSAFWKHCFSVCSSLTHRRCHLLHIHLHVRPRLTAAYWTSDDLDKTRQ